MGLGSPFKTDEAFHVLFRTIPNLVWIQLKKYQVWETGLRHIASEELSMLEDASGETGLRDSVSERSAMLEDADGETDMRHIVPTFRVVGRNLATIFGGRGFGLISRFYGSTSRLV